MDAGNAMIARRRNASCRVSFVTPMLADASMSGRSAITRRMGAACGSPNKEAAVGASSMSNAVTIAARASPIVHATS
jgi:hypothetical protein